MKLSEVAGVGVITKQNTTQDVKPGETKRQAKKLGLLHPTAAKNSNPSTLMNLGIGEDEVTELRIEKPDPKDTLGIERKFMPQIKSDDYEEFIEYLTKNGVKFKQETIPARELQAMQSQFSDKGIIKQLEKNIAKGPNTKAVIASSDDYILDGHHRWLVAVNTGTDLNVYRVNMPAWKLYDLVNKFQKVYYKDIYDEGKPTIGVPLSSGLTVSIFPHRPLKIKKSTPGKLRYDEGVAIAFTPLYEEWSAKYKRSINCNNPKGFSQRAHCAGRKKKKSESIGEAYMLQLERVKDLAVLHVKDTKTGERMEVRGKPGYETNYDSNDKLHRLLDIIGKASNISELMNGEIVNVNPKHPDGPRSYSALNALMNEGSEITMWTNPEYQGSDVDDEYYNRQPAKLIDINKLTPFEPADKMDDEISAANMNKLVKAIQAGKKINPIVVVPHKGKLLIIDGHHRYFATIKAGVDKIRAVMADPKDLTWRDDVPVEEAKVDEDANSDKVYELLLDNIGAGPFDGGCVVVAQALQLIHGGELMALVRNDGTADHAVVQKGNTMYDFDGPGTPEEVVSRFEKNEGTRIAEVRKLRMSDLPDAPRNSELAKQIAILMKEPVQEAKVDEGVNDPHIFKAVFLAGGPGSGKSFVARNILGGTGLRSVNSDEVYEFLMKKQGLSLDPETIFSPQGQEIRDKAKGISRKRERTYLDGRLGLIIDGTGKDVNKYKVMAEKLRAIGYDTSMIYVNTSLDVAQQRNRQRERSLEPAKVEQMWNEVQQNLMKFQQIFGAGRFHIIDNSGGLEDLDRQKNFDKVYNETQRFLNTPPSKPKAKQWIQQQKEQNDEKRSATQPTNNQSNGGTPATN